MSSGIRFPAAKRNAGGGRYRRRRFRSYFVVWGKVQNGRPRLVLTLAAVSPEGLGAPLVHVGEPLHRFGETGDCRIGVPMLNAIADAVLDMAFQHNLPAPVER